jgi:hypothetical protein
MRYFDEDQNGTLDALELEQIIKKHKVSEASLVEFGGDGMRRLNLCMQAASQPADLRTSAESQLILDHIKSIPFFQNYTEDQALQICRSLAKIEFVSGEYIFRVGEVADNFYVLLGGEVSVIVNGKEIKTLSPISSFGELALLKEVRSFLVCMPVFGAQLHT